MKQTPLAHNLFWDITDTYLPYSAFLAQPPFIRMYANVITLALYRAPLYSFTAVFWKQYM